MDWEKAKAAFYCDGSLRDVYVRNTTIEDWNRFLAYASQQSASYYVDGALLPLHYQASEIFEERDRKARLLAINLGKVVLNCHFFTVDELELDIDPKQVTSNHAFDAVFQALTDIGKTLKKDVILTDENAPTSEWLRYEATSGTLKFSRA